MLRNPSAPLPENVSTVGVEVAEWVLSPPAHLLKGTKKNQPLQRVSLNEPPCYLYPTSPHPLPLPSLFPQHQMDIVFSTWDLAGQEVYYATHQCFLSRNTLYLVVWSMEEGDRGIEYLRPWLLNIQVGRVQFPLEGSNPTRVVLNNVASLRFNSLLKVQTPLEFCAK